MHIPFHAVPMRSQSWAVWWLTWLSPLPHLLQKHSSGISPPARNSSRLSMYRYAHACMQQFKACMQQFKASACRDRQTHTCAYIYTHTHTHTCAHKFSRANPRCQRFESYGSGVFCVVVHTNLSTIWCTKTRHHHRSVSCWQSLRMF